MQEKSVLTGHLSELKQKIENGLEELKSSKELYEFKSEYLEGKKSKISGLMKEMKNIAPEERANYGKSVNELKEWALGRFQKVEEEMKERELQKKYESEKIDLTLPAEETAIGNLHPVTLIRKQLIDIFAGMGFEVYEGREIETDYYNFTALNTPQDHPARDMQDTFYLSPEFLLRTQTSAALSFLFFGQVPLPETAPSLDRDNRQFPGALLDPRSFPPAPRHILRTHKFRKG